MSAAGLHDVRAIVFDFDDTLYARRDFELSTFDEKARGWQTVRVRTGDFGELSASSAKAADLTLARVTGLPASSPYRWVARQ